MRWANFLHIYQPADQQPDILEAIVEQSYRPLFRGFIANPKSKATLNISGALLELFDRHGYGDLLDMLRQLGEEGRVEFTGTAKYHAFLPLLDDDEIHRQILAHEDSAKYFLKNAYKPKGFFPPEMGYHSSLPAILESFGFKWVIVDEVAYNGDVDILDRTKTYQIKGSSLNVFFRNRRVSNMIMSAVVRSADSFREALKDEISSNRYAITGMDGETFGHHRPGMESILFELMNMPDVGLSLISELSEAYTDVQEVDVVQSTWASSPEDIARGVQFLSWKDPGNEIHAVQWKFVKLVLDSIKLLPDTNPAWKTTRAKLDSALASDHFWWASAKPWWSLEMVEAGAWRLLDTIRSMPNIPAETLQVASSYYESIVSTAFQWQRSGKVRKMIKSQQIAQRIPFKERTLGAGGAEEGVYRAFLDMLSEQEKKAVAKGEYEKAILWRDSIYKIEHNTDIYDAVNAIDLLRTEMPNSEIERIIEEYKGRYREIRGGQPEQRG